MARKPVARPARAAFAALLAQHLAGGTRPASASGEPWTFAAFAAEVPSGRANDFVSARSVSNWCKGTSLPAEIGPILRALFGPDTNPRHADAREALRRAFQAARAELLQQTKPDPAGPRWKIENDQEIVIDRGVRPADRDAADDPLHRQLQGAIVELAKALVQPASRLTNTRTWGRLSATAAAFHDTLSCDPLAMPDRLGLAYAQLLELGGCLETDIRVQRDKAAMDDPLDADIHGRLTALVRTAAPWLRGFPTVQTWDDDAGKALLRPGLFQPAQDFVRLARAKQLIPERDAAEMAVLAAAAGEAGYQQEKAGKRDVAGATNLMLTTALALLSGSVSSDFSTRSPLVQRAGATLAAGEAAITALAATWQSDLRQAVLGLVKERQHSDVDNPATDAIETDPEIPEDVEDQARTMVLAGQSPPAAWRPFIHDLDFSWTDLDQLTPLAGLIALQRLYLSGTPVSDLAPLAGLTALQRLDLSGTPVSDVAPLAGLTVLQMLSLNGTRVSDVAPLAGLIALQRLYLGGTQVSDVAPLAGLTVLQMLSLNGTPVSNIAPLAGLVGLRELHLEDTAVRDL